MFLPAWNANVSGSAAIFAIEEDTSLSDVPAPQVQTINIDTMQRFEPVAAIATQRFKPPTLTWLLPKHTPTR